MSLLYLDQEYGCNKYMCLISVGNMDSCGVCGEFCQLSDHSSMSSLFYEQEVGYILQKYLTDNVLHCQCYLKGFRASDLPL